MSKPPRILAIAGSDSSGGAGIQADIKTITMLGGYAMTATTAATAQNTLGVHAVETHSAKFVAAQIDACLSDIGADAIKVGMLGSPEIADIVAGRLTDFGGPIVFDPVMIATNGAVLADAGTIAAFDRLMAIATLTTPNLPELDALGGLDAVQRKTSNLLVKGGHAAGKWVEDTLYASHAEHIFRTNRIETKHTHGTGCTLASAIATGLGERLAVKDAVERAIRFVEKALLAAPQFGHGNGPIGPHYRWDRFLREAGRPRSGWRGCCSLRRAVAAQLIPIDPAHRIRRYGSKHRPPFRTNGTD